MISGCEEIVFHAITLLNAVTLQLQLIVAHIAIEIFRPKKYPNPDRKGSSFIFGPFIDGENFHVNWSAIGIQQLLNLIEVCSHEKKSLLQSIQKGYIKLETDEKKLDLKGSV